MGIDNISNETIIFSKEIMVPIYKKIFNNVLIHHHYPLIWKKGILVNLLKNGDPYNPENYRGLTINSCLGKVFNSSLK